MDRDANYEPIREEPPPVAQGALLPQGDDELLDTQACADLAGCDLKAWNIGVQNQMFPQPHGSPWQRTGTKANGKPQWTFSPRWRKGAVIAALNEIARRARTTPTLE